MLMPTPGSPERFQEALSGKLPGNYRELTYAQQELLSKARGFAAQRGLFKDEVAGLFGAFNRKDYMYGLKDLIMELYDCPDYSDKDTQTGLTIVQNAAPSILGVTTPAGLAAAITPADWANGLLPRFLLLTPEPDYAERPTLKQYEPPPGAVVNGLKALHQRLPLPQQEGDGWAAPAALEVEAQCWDAVQAYSSRLSKLCDPNDETPLDDRLKGVYGRLHVQAVKLALILAALDWMGTDRPEASHDPRSLADRRVNVRALAAERPPAGRPPRPQRRGRATSCARRTAYWRCSGKPGSAGSAARRLPQPQAWALDARQPDGAGAGARRAAGASTRIGDAVRTLMTY